MVFYVLGALSVVTFGLCTAEKLTLPVTTCMRDSPKYNTCLKNAVEEAWPRFMEGLPKFDFPTVDPLIFPHLTNVYETNEVHGEIHMDDMFIIGLKNTSFGTVRTHFANNVFNFVSDVSIPRLMVTGEFQIKGNFLGIPLNTQGLLNASIEDIKTNWDFIGSVVNNTWTIEDSRSFPSFKNMKIYIKDPTGVNQDLNDFISSFMNTYWPALYRAVMPIISKSWNARLIELSNILFSKVSFSAVFP